MSAAVSLGLMMVPVAAARAAATWTGAFSSPEWSETANWTGTPPVPNAPPQTLTFPTLGASCATCYTSHNDLTQVSALGLVFSNRSGAYRILGNPLTVGSGGISDGAGAGTGTAINAPLVLSAPQTWSVGGRSGYNVLTLLGGITGPGEALTVAFPAVYDGDLFIDSDLEVGPVTATGIGGLHIGSPTQPGSLNGGNGQPVTIDAATLVANPRSTSGPLSLRDGTLLLGTNPQNNGATTLSVNGGVAIGAASTTATFINANGSGAGTDFSQLSASGAVTLGGQLSVGQAPVGGQCATLQPGDVATLFTTTGTLTGTFTNAPEGATSTMTSSCQTPPAQIRIDYTGDSVTATVLGSPPPASTAVPPSPSPPKKPGGRVLGPQGRLTVIRQRLRAVEKCQSSVLCRGRLSLTASLRPARRHRAARTMRCAAASFRIPAGRSGAIRARVAAGCLKVLRGERRHRLTVTSTTRVSTGQAGQRKRVTLVLKEKSRPRPRRTGQEPSDDQTSSLVRIRSTTAEVNSVVPAWPPRSGVFTPAAIVSRVPS